MQADVTSEERKDEGLQPVFKSVFPIKDFNETASLEFVSYELGAPKYDVEKCHQRSMTYAAPLKVAAAPAVEKDEFNVILTAAGDKKIQVIKVVR